MFSHIFKLKIVHLLPLHPCSDSIPSVFGNSIKPHFADSTLPSCIRTYGALQCNYHAVWTRDYWKIYRKVNKELKPLLFSLIKLSTVQQQLICVFYPITVNIFRPNNLIRGPDGWSEAFLCTQKSGLETHLCLKPWRICMGKKSLHDWRSLNLTYV